MLSEPNIDSPANVDASIMFRNKREEYDRIVLGQVEESKKVAAREGIMVPTTVDEYVYRPEEQMPEPDCETSDDEKYVVHFDEDSEVESGSAMSESESEDEDAEKKNAEMTPGTARKCRQEIPLPLPVCISPSFVYAFFSRRAFPLRL